MFTVPASLLLLLAISPHLPDTAAGTVQRGPAGLAVAEFRVAVAPAETLAVAAAGDGLAVILLSGPIGSVFTWRHILEAPALAGNRLVVIDPLGMGRSARPPGADYSLEAQARRIYAMMDSLDITSAVIVGHGVSGSIAMRLALLHPERVIALVSVEGGPAERAGSPGIKKALAFAPLLKLFGGKRMIRGKIRSGLRDASGDPAWVTEEVVDRYAEGPAADVGATLRTLGAMADARESQALTPRLGAIAVPVAFVFGGAQHAGGPSDQEMNLLHAGMSGAEFIRIEGAGHYLQEESPDAVVRTISRMSVIARAGP